MSETKDAVPDLDLLIRDCTVVTPDTVFDGWVGVLDGRIASMGAERQPPRAQRVVRAKGLHLLPGRIEPHSHLRASSLRDELSVNSREAVAGGVTTLMPYMRAPESYLGLLPAWVRTVDEVSYCDVLFHLQIQIRDHLAEIAECHDRFGVRSFKVHIDARQNANFGLLPVDDGDLYFAMLAVKAFDGVVAVHCEDSEITRYLEADARDRGETGLDVWERVRPALTEAIDANTAGYIADRLGCRLLVVHVSSEETIRAVERYADARPTVEALVHQLAITAADAESRVGAAGKMNPPLRGQREIDDLWEAIRAGQIDFVGTDDHVGSASNLAGRELSPEEFWSAESASPGIGIGTPLLLTEGLRRGTDLRDLSRLMSHGPARTFAIDDRKGAIAVGKDADLMLVDLKLTRTVEVGRPTSLNLTVADGLSLCGWPRMTMLRGQIVFEDDEFVAPPTGSVVVPSGRTVAAVAPNAGGTFA